MSKNSGGRLTQIGLDRLVRLEWLEQTASLVLAGNDDQRTKTALHTSIKGHFRSDDSVVRGSIDKTITILLKTWLRVPVELDSLRVVGLELLAHTSRTEHSAVHWGMLMAVYPFWSSVAAQVGRLLRLQGSASAAQVQRRMREQYGERETVARRARYVLRSFVDWGALRETDAKGTYAAGVASVVDSPPLIAWLVEASLHARGSDSAPLGELVASPSLFPFHLATPSITALERTGRLELMRQAVNEDVVMLRQRATN